MEALVNEAARESALEDVNKVLQQNIKTTDMTDIIAEFFSSRPGSMAAYIISLMVATVVNLVVLTKLTSIIYRKVNLNERKNAFFYFGFLAVGMLVLVGLNFAVDYIEAGLMPDFDTFAKKFFTGRVLYHNSQQFLNQNPIVYRNMLTTSTTAAASVFNAIVQNYIPNIILSGVLLTFLAYLDWKYFAVFLVAVSILVGLFFLFRDGVNESSKALEKHENSVKTDTFDIFRSMDTIIVKNTAEQELNTLNEKLIGLRKAEKDFLMATNSFSYIMYSIIAAAIIATSALAIDKMGKPGVSVTSIMLSLTLMATLRNKMQNIASTNTTVIKDMGRYTAVQMDALNAPPVMETESESFVVPAGTTPSIVMRDLSFTYPNSDRPSVVGFNWAAWQGVNCLRGASGCGKSTIGRILVGLYRGYTGAITIDGVECRTMPRSYLRTLVTLSQQTMSVLNRSLRDTILYGAQPAEVDLEELGRLWNQVSHVFNGLTLEDDVGIDGDNLSTGQLQLLRIVGLQLSAQKVVVLDEPCSGLDSTLKKSVLNLIRSMGQIKTVILITHDAETAAVADRVQLISPPSV
jgi:ABC-type multidrug transport system fused ATPase/permease subunit